MLDLCVSHFSILNAHTHKNSYLQPSPCVSLVWWQSYFANSTMNRQDGHMFFMRHGYHDDFRDHFPPKPGAMRFLNPRNPYHEWGQEVRRHNVLNITRACERYWEVLPKYKYIKRKLQLERAKASELRRDFRRSRHRAKKCRTTRSQTVAHLELTMALSDAKWSIAALEREVHAGNDILLTVCHFIGVGYMISPMTNMKVINK
jgi:hypothetical protein